MTRSQKKYLDKTWSQVILKRDGKCQRCSRTDTLNPHHIFGRRSLNTRWILENGVCLCALHHSLGRDSAHQNPYGFLEWLKQKKGEKFLRDLEITNNMYYKPDYIAIKMYLESELKKLEKI